VSARLVVARQDGVLFLTFDSDDGFPLLEGGATASLAQQMEALAHESELKGCVIRGSDRAFAAGAEIAELARLTPSEAYEFSRAGQEVFRRIEHSRKPVIAAIRGYCIGGGLDLALVCHERVAAADAVFAHPGGSLGIITGWGGTQRLPRLIGRARAMEMLVTGCRLDAQEALACGLVTRIVSSEVVVAEAIRRARKLANE
jgi:enoyl-CoA hydratase/carnithine racemase